MRNICERVLGGPGAAESEGAEGQGDRQVQQESQSDDGRAVEDQDRHEDQFGSVG